MDLRPNTFLDQFKLFKVTILMSWCLLISISFTTCQVTIMTNSQECLTPSLEVSFASRQMMKIDQ